MYVETFIMIDTRRKVCNKSVKIIKVDLFFTRLLVL